VIETEGDAHGAEVEAAGGIGGLVLLGDNQFGGLQRPQDNVVRWDKHNDDTLVLACHLIGDVLLLLCLVDNIMVFFLLFLCISLYGLVLFPII
jgi:hypothetical protein